ncbi:hypothetical protein [Limimaricola soesokkakensis]|uniref:hypothetical protein n=1 Tax=Limimaricola soesokkakensis TaxID=1343159 RepID=UPI003513A8FB
MVIFDLPGHLDRRDPYTVKLIAQRRARRAVRKAKIDQRDVGCLIPCRLECLLIACLAYQVMHVARHAMAEATSTGWSLRRWRERVLRAGARLVISARRMTLVLSSAAAPFWAALWPRLMTLQWADPGTWRLQQTRRPSTPSGDEALCAKLTGSLRAKPYQDPSSPHRGDSLLHRPLIRPMGRAESAYHAADAALRPPKWRSVNNAG